ncbi:hypothetical protein QQF64_034618 [Cirrhinus molitorella]|uniref:Integrase catalytic domain-containing protein n=1 Tax=Cirrhinus molitorella TaxID=172907 RepID=A0ABR3L0T9_9TELE
MGVCEILGIKRSLCAPYHPQTNGLVERLNGTIQRSLSKLVGKEPHKWSDYLEATMFGLRTKKQITTRYSPYFVMFGREARYPCEVPEKYEINETIEDTIAEEFIGECIKRQDRIYKMVQDNITNVQHKTKKRKLEKGLSLHIQVGDRVLRQNIRSRQRKGGKLDPDYIGSYTVINVEGKSIDLKDDKGHCFPKINKDHLVHFIESPQIPAATQPPVFAAPTQPAQPPVFAAPTQPAQPPVFAAPTQPAQPPVFAAPTQPAQPPVFAAPTQPAQPPVFAAPTQPAQPPVFAAPTQPAQPPVFAAPTQPAQPPVFAAPTQPAQPPVCAAPTQPAQPPACAALTQSHTNCSLCGSLEFENTAANVGRLRKEIALCLLQESDAHIIPNSKLPQRQWSCDAHPKDTSD